MIDYLGFGYALMVAGGGVMGYVQAKSIPSLAAGLLFGSVIGFGAYQVSAHNKVYVSLATSAALGGMMGYRFYGSGKIMPAGFIAAMSLGMFVRYSMLALTPSTEKPSRA
uniref:Transmembrane protein 14C n=1 Tax=Lygus hesperus TaxID=30085 RepID=A0A0A9XZA0_LYGHE